MKLRFSNAGLRTQIGSIVVLAIVSLATIGGIYQLGKTERDRRIAEATVADAVADAAVETEIGLLQMRRTEKNFMMRADPAYADEHKEIRKRVAASLEALRRAAGENSRHADEIRRITAGVADYAATFDKLVDQRSRLGLTPEQGLEGELRKAVHALETEIRAFANPALELILLQMRRHEKDYMLRRDDKYVADLEKRVREFLAELAVTPISQASAKSMGKVVEDYRANFLRWVEASRGSAQAEKAMMAVHRGLEPILDGLEKAVGDEARVAHITAGEASATAETRVLWAFGLVTLLLAVVAGLIARTVSRQMCGMTWVMTQLAGGNLEVEIPGRDKTNELGRMAGAVEVFRDNARERRRLEVLQESDKARAEADRRRAMHELADDFERRIGGVVAMVSSAATELEAAAQTLAASAEEASAQSIAVAGASEEATANVQSVAAATEELSTTVREVGGQVERSAEIAAKASAEADATRTQVRGLSEAADRIGSIVQLIQEIASKTNLLALNATIEAARAGEAGRGFAIVAQEVKGLAGQTAHATAEIGTQVQAIQSSTQFAADAITAIGRTIGEMNGIAGAIAAAVEEQSVTTQEIAGNLGQAARGAADVSANIVGVSTAAESSSAASTQVLASAGELAHQAEALRGAVAAFLRDVRAA